MHGGATEDIIWILALALVTGAATRAFSQWTRVPYTIAVLLVGMAAGLALRWAASHGADAGLVNLVVEGRVLSPALIMFVFLPALVFESAFSLDAYAFRKELGPVSVLAVPALLASTLLTAAWMVGATSGSWQWGWGVALVFGAVMSATDPVAVVALLREVGAPKRLGVLIEGESLLNDGTAIVLFGVLLQFLAASGAAPPDAVAVIVTFLKVVAGGVLVGLVVAAILSEWISRTFNDPMVEITLTLVMAYAAMMLAEGLLHVSGVIAVVTAGLWMSGFGKTRISPEVSGFLHHFWELLSYLANTIIFLLVGVVIAVQVGSASRNALLVVGASFIGIVLVRFAVLLAFRPLLGLVGDALSWGETVVMSWSGLRGAVSLSLALAINQNPDIPRLLREQLLVATAGVVLLTLVLNGATVKRLLHMFGYDRRPPGEVLSQLTAASAALEEVVRKIHAVRDSGELVTVPWSSVEAQLRERTERIEIGRRELTREAETSSEDPSIRFWRQALAIERKSHWDAYNRGVLGGRAARILDHEIEVQLDDLRRGIIAPPARRTPQFTGLLSRLSSLGRRIGFGTGTLERGRLALRYDLSRAESRGARDVLEMLDRFDAFGEASPEVSAALSTVYRRYAIAGKEGVEELRSTLPEVSRTIETRLANRIALNYEREAIERLEKRGVIDPRSSASLHAEINEGMKVLWRERGHVALPDFRELCAETPLFSRLDRETIDEIAELSTERVLAPGEILFEQGDAGDSMYIIARGAAYVLRERPGEEPEIYSVLGGGEIVGEMALLSGASRSATVRAATTLTLFRIDRGDFERLCTNRPLVEREIWSAFTEHCFDSVVRTSEPFSDLSRERRILWIRSGDTLLLSQGDRIPESTEDGPLFVVQGELERDGRRISGPALIESPDRASLSITSPAARIVALPATPATPRSQIHE